jgi:hypothetical protein
MGKALILMDGTNVDVVSTTTLANGLVVVQGHNREVYTVHPSRIKENDDTMSTVSEFSINGLKNRPNCILYTKKGIRFDHERIDVQAHVLLCVGENPRKMCFNTYNGQLGKDNKLPDFDGFCAGAASKTFYKVACIDKEQKKLAKQGYEKI